jgi:hypothetical protein
MGAGLAPALTGRLFGLIITRDPVRRVLWVHVERAPTPQAARRPLVPRRGRPVRGTERLTGVSREAILGLLVRVGEGCPAPLDETMRDLPCECPEIDELWAFVQKKQRHVKQTDDAARVGDPSTHVAIDADTKLVPCVFMGKGNAATTNVVLTDRTPRLRYRVQIAAPYGVWP